MTRPTEETGAVERKHRSGRERRKDQHGTPSFSPENYWREIWHPTCPESLSGIYHRGNGRRVVSEDLKLHAYECMACGIQVWAGLDVKTRRIHVEMDHDSRTRPDRRVSGESEGPPAESQEARDRMPAENLDREVHISAGGSVSTGEWEARCIEGCHLDVPTGGVWHAPGCPVSTGFQGPSEVPHWISRALALVERSLASTEGMKAVQRETGGNAPTLVQGILDGIARLRASTETGEVNEVRKNLWTPRERAERLMWPHDPEEPQGPTLTFRLPLKLVEDFVGGATHIEDQAGTVLTPPIRPLIAKKILALHESAARLHDPEGGDET